ncbi:hypothetical protein WMY93_001437 [Mugilogobius chulae]|uniref:AKNA domain-containing protein n=1 Tax=Mugilogobius chulae TaxID=88201 RepID=A0AAW0QH66_9GOBI
MAGGPRVLDDEPVVLWEKCIQQSIIVDLREDESIHFSDLESSLAFASHRWTQAPQRQTSIFQEMQKCLILTALQSLLSTATVEEGSFSEIKYGQGQVHYPLPDFSKVAPKVKIPKTPKESPKPMPPSTIHRAHSSPDMLDVVNRVLEDSVFTQERPSLFFDPEESAPPAFVQHLQMLKILMEAQDELERKYISKKEEHRALEMQKYMGINRNTGTFDPDRLLEGDIFRLGMILDDIKEMVDKNLCEQISLPQTSSTPLSLHIKPRVLCVSPPSSPSLHELTFQDQSASLCFGTNEMEDTIDAIGPMITEQTKNTDVQICSRPPHTFQKDLTPSAEDKDQQDETSLLTEGAGFSNILAYFDVTNVSPEESLAASKSTQVRALHLESDLDNCVSLSVEVSCSSEASTGCDNVPKSSLQTSVSQRNETDSGFGSSYLNQSASGSVQQNESFHSQNDPVSSTESEGSCSNLQTTIEPKVQRTFPSVGSELPIASNSVQQWVENANKETIFKVQGRHLWDFADIKHNHISESLSQPILDKMDGGWSPMRSCSCNNEAILALQSDVSRLKKDMKESLIQLPYLTDKLDYLTSKYRHERTTRSRSRSHQRLTANSPLKSQSVGLTLSNTSPSPVKLERMSTYIDPVKSKDSEDTTASDMQFDYSPIEGTKGSATLYLDSGLHSPGPTLSSRGNYTRKSEQFYYHARLKDPAFVERWSPIYSTPTQKPLLQVNYGSSSSLPASQQSLTGRDPPNQTLPYCPVMCFFSTQYLLCLHPRS